MSLMLFIPRLDAQLNPTLQRRWEPRARTLVISSSTTISEQRCQVFTPQETSSLICIN